MDVIYLGIVLDPYESLVSNESGLLKVEPIGLDPIRARRYLLEGTEPSAGGRVKLAGERTRRERSVLDL